MFLATSSCAALLATSACSTHRASTAADGAAAAARPPTRELRCVGSFGTFHGSGAEPAARTVVEPVRKREWEASLGGEVAARPYVRARMTGWPAKLLVARDSLPKDDNEFLRRVARDTWRGFE